MAFVGKFDPPSAMISCYPGRTFSTGTQCSTVLERANFLASSLLPRLRRDAARSGSPRRGRPHCRPPLHRRCDRRLQNSRTAQAPAPTKAGQPAARAIRRVLAFGTRGDSTGGAGFKVRMASADARGGNRCRPRGASGRTSQAELPCPDVSGYRSLRRRDVESLHLPRWRIFIGRVTSNPRSSSPGPASGGAGQCRRL